MNRPNLYIRTIILIAVAFCYKVSCAQTESTDTTIDLRINILKKKKAGHRPDTTDFSGIIYLLVKQDTIAAPYSDKGLTINKDQLQKVKNAPFKKDSISIYIKKGSDFLITAPFNPISIQCACLLEIIQPVSKRDPFQLMFWSRWTYMGTLFMTQGKNLL